MLVQSIGSSDYVQQNKSTYLTYKIAQSYKIEVPKDIQGIHPCVLFYYANDEVEFVPPEKFKWIYLLNGWWLKQWTPS